MGRQQLSSSTSGQCEMTASNSEARLAYYNTVLLFDDPKDGRYLIRAVVIHPKQSPKGNRAGLSLVGGSEEEKQADQTRVLTEPRFSFAQAAHVSGGFHKPPPTFVRPLGRIDMLSGERFLSVFFIPSTFFVHRKASNSKCKICWARAG